SVISTATSLAQRAAAAVRSAMKIKSPSRVMMEIGGYFVEGFTKQVGKDTKYAVSASTKMYDAITDGLNPDMNYDVAGVIHYDNRQVTAGISNNVSTSMEVVPKKQPTFIIKNYGDVELIRTEIETRNGVDSSVDLWNS